MSRAARRSLMSSEVTELINALQEGKMSLDQVVERFRERSWPRRAGPPPATYLDLAAAAQKDPEPDVPGSFDEVTAAYDRGELNRTDYRILADAAADSMRAEDERRGAGAAESE
jgi:hypothetical protein